MKTSELTGAALDWAVGKCEDTLLDSTMYQYSTDWAWGGPIIEREGVDVMHIRALDLTVGWEATADSGETYYEGPTPLIAAMRCYVTFKLGDEIEVPKEIK